MATKAPFIYLLLALLGIRSAHAQEKTVNMYDSAQVYYKVKDFKKASRFFDIYYIEQQKAQSNYDTYFAAVAASHVGNLERAKYYLKRSAEIGYDVSNYSFFAEDPNNVPLRALPEWKKFVGDFKIKSDSAKLAMDKITAEINDTTVRAQASLLNDTAYWKNWASKHTATQLIKKIKNFNSFLPTKKDNFWTFYQIKANDTLNAPFMVYIPKNYQPNKRTPLYVYLHGAVINRANFAQPAYIPDGLESKTMAKAMEQHALILYPLGKKSFGWLYHQQAFETILKQIAFVKSRYNVDDNHVYIGGHSNGGSGAFWFAINQPTPFASFFGFNYLPRNYSGNTSLRNLRNNRTFYGISGAEDTTFPLPLVNGIYTYATANGANWKNFVKTGNHSLPFVNRQAIDFIFDTLSVKSRIPFPKKIEWETDNVQNGRNSWIEICQLDTTANKADWHVTLNPTVMQKGKPEQAEFNKNKSGAVKAVAEGNTVYIQTSRVKRIMLYISPDMFNLQQQLKISINNRQLINLTLALDKTTIVEEFLRTKDRKLIVSSKVEIVVE